MLSPLLMQMSLTGLPGFIINPKSILGYKILCSESQVINMMIYWKLSKLGKKIKIAIAGMGNCASAIIQGAKYYTENNHDTIGLTAFNLGGYEPGDIEVVAAFDVADTKVGKDVSEAIYARPNNTITVAEVPHMGVSKAT